MASPADQAFLVTGAQQNHGLGRVLSAHPITIALANSVPGVAADVLRDHRPMMHSFLTSGLAAKIEIGRGVYTTSR